MESEFFDLDANLELMDKFNNDVFKQILPNSRFFIRSFAGSREGRFSYENLLTDTVYYTDLQQSLLHFTSLQSLSAILQNGFFRLSEFGHFEDITELHFANKVFSENEFLKLNKDSIENLKSNCFALSACRASDETLKKSFMW